MNTIERIRELEHQREQLIQSAHDEAIECINTAIDTLKALGYQYTLVGKKKPPRKSKAPTAPNKPCPICEFATAPPHDKRHHRSQEQVAPFNDDDLREKRMRRLDDQTDTSSPPVELADVGAE